MSQDASGNWTFDLFTEWPTNISVNVWGINPDGNPDKTAAYGDVDQDGVLDWIPPDSLAPNVINISTAPGAGYVGYRLLVNDGNYSYTTIPYGSATLQGLLMILLCLIPIAAAVTAVYLYTASFYKVKFNKVGIKVQSSSYLSFGKSLPFLASRVNSNNASSTSIATAARMSTHAPNTERENLSDSSEVVTSGVVPSAVAVEAGATGRRTVLLATMEYEITEWNIKIKIGGLGVMASLMAKNLHHQDLIWVIPCVGDKSYPFDQGRQFLIAIY